MSTQSTQGLLAVAEARRRADEIRRLGKGRLLAEVAAAYNAGASQLELVTRYHKSPATISKWLDEAVKAGLIGERRKGPHRRTQA